MHGLSMGKDSLYCAELSAAAGPNVSSVWTVQSPKPLWLKGTGGQHKRAQHPRSIQQTCWLGLFTMAGLATYMFQVGLRNESLPAAKLASCKGLALFGPSNPRYGLGI